MWRHKVIGLLLIVSLIVLPSVMADFNFLPAPSQSMYTVYKGGSQDISYTVRNNDPSTALSCTVLLILNKSSSQTYQIPSESIATFNQPDVAQKVLSIIGGK